jgi:hypothetical protein
METFFHPGQSDYLLITFNPFGVAANGRDYWGKSLVEKNSINCLSFASRRSNWFPAVDVEAAAKNVAGILEYFKGQIILYGTSMGGYAAIKYSRLLSATCVLAFSPQYSINPEDVGTFERRFCSWYNLEQNRDMKISAADVSGTVFLFCDPRQGDDVAHANAIAESLMQPVYVVPVPYTGHSAVEIFASSDNAKRLFCHGLANAPLDVAMLTRDLRRISNVRVRTLARCLGFRHAGRALAIYRAYADRFDARSLMLLSDAIRARDTVSAVEIATIAVDMAPTDARSHFYLAQALRAIGEDQAALRSAAQAATLDNQQPQYAKLALELAGAER